MLTVVLCNTHIVATEQLVTENQEACNQQSSLFGLHIFVYTNYLIKMLPRNQIMNEKILKSLSSYVAGPVADGTDLYKSCVWSGTKNLLFLFLNRNFASLAELGCTGVLTVVQYTHS